jgi:CRISPR type I-E-associated protein CasB/Cse2
MSEQTPNSSRKTDTAPEEKDKEHTTKEARFVYALQSLDAGSLAILKRCSGRTIGEASGRAKLIFYRILREEAPAVNGSRDEEIYFLVATLLGLNKHNLSGDFGRTMRMITKKTTSASIDNRMAILLDSEFDLIGGRRPGGGELAWRLRQCVRLATSHEVGVNWTQLLKDLKYWNHPEKRARKRWARSYFGTAPIPRNSALQAKGDTE